MCVCVGGWGGGVYDLTLISTNIFHCPSVKGLKSLLFSHTLRALYICCRNDHILKMGRKYIMTEIGQICYILECYGETLMIFRLRWNQ